VWEVTCPFPKGYLRRGDSNANVKRLQLLLIEFGFLTGSADGVFGPKTEAALRKMQREHNITVDGIYGSQSRAVLVELKNRQD
jgi:peptidoglycan hydrolase-like protein with peptidoglycan-binding domain